jgi:diguanylate cyclase (GGDEF)-like protein
VRRTSSFLSPAILLDLWETRAGRVLRALGLGSVRTTILTLAVLAVLIPALATSYLSYQQNRRAILAKLDQQLSTASGQAARETDLWLKERLYDLRVFASSYVLFDNIAQPGAQARARLRDYVGAVKDRSPDYDELMVMTPDRRTVASSARVPGDLHLAGDWLSRARVGDAVLGEPARGDSAARATMEVAVPIVNPAGRFLGVLAGRLSLKGVEEVLREEARGGELRLSVVLAGGEAIASAGGAPASRPRVILEELQRAESTALSYRTPDGLALVGALASVPRSDWSAVAELPAASAFEDIRRLRNATAVLLVVLLGVVGGLAYGLGLLIVHPLDRLSVAARRVAGGDLDVDVPVSGGGELSHLTGVFNDMVRRLRESRDELERLSVTDELTGLTNRRGMTTELERELLRSHRHEHPCAILMLDVDRFKHFNDTYGHPAGDAALRRLAGTLRECVRDVDTAARYGGEEFLVILPETGPEEARQVAERIRERTESDGFAPEPGAAPIHITVSLGFAGYPEHADTPDTLVAAADEALYRSKEAGRNRVTAARPGAGA